MIPQHTIKHSHDEHVLSFDSVTYHKHNTNKSPWLLIPQYTIKHKLDDFAVAFDVTIWPA